MSTGDLISIHPSELKFPCKFPSVDLISCFVGEKLRFELGFLIMNIDASLPP